MNMDRFLTTAKTWINPSFPGVGKSPLLGFILGFFFGVFGVGIYLRSVVDFALSLMLCMALIGMAPNLATWLCPILCGLWVVGRIAFDTRRAGGGATPAMASASSAAMPVSA